MNFSRAGSRAHQVDWRRRTTFAALLTCLWLVESCGSSTDAKPPAVATVIVTAATSQLIVGQSHQMTLRLEDAEGNVLTNRTTQWSTTNNTVATVSTAGLVQAHAPGSVQIVATSETVSGSAAMGIVAAVAQVTVEPRITRLIRGSTQQLTAVPRDNNGTPLSERAIAWTSSNIAVASVSPAGIVAGLVSGSVQIMATSEGKTGSLSFTVDEPVASVTVEPAVATVFAGQTFQLSATARDLAGSVLPGRTINWLSANTAIARVSGGLVTGVAAGGPVDIVASTEGKADTATISVIPDPCSTDRPIALGDTVTGFLQNGDCQLDDGSYLDFWRFSLSAETSVLIEMNSAALDAWLWLTDAQQYVIDYDNNSGPGTDARVRIKLPAGTYLIGANSFSGGETGAYTLSLNVDPNAAMCAVFSPIAIGDTVTGTIADTDCVIDGAFFSDRWRLHVGSRQAFDIQMSSQTMEPFVYVTDLSGQTVAVNLNGGGSPFKLKATLDAGDYDVWASTWWNDATGDYELSVRRDPCGNYGTLTLGQGVSGALATGDCMLNDVSLADPWRLVVTDSTLPLRIDLSSSDFDAYLVLTDPFGNVLATDDDGGPGSSARIETTLCCGEYLVWANSYVPGGNGTYSLTAARLAPAPVNLVVDGAYLVQNTQRYDGTVPLVQGRSALIRVFGRASIGNSSTPSARVRLYDQGVLVETINIPATSSSVRTTVNQGSILNSWNATIPAARVKPGLSYTVEIDPEALVSESDETDNTWPKSGQTRPVNVRAVPALNLTFVPVRQQANGLLGNVTTSNVSAYTDMTRRLYPLDVVNTFVHATYTTSLPALDPSDNNESWWKLLGELEAIRVAENQTHHYFGVVKVAYSSGIAGISYGIPARTSAGVDWSSASTITAHELGHNFGRYHSPCGGAGGPDPSYPYADGSIGVFGYNVVAQAVVPSSTPDIMSYCQPPWISDYTFEGVLDYRETNPAPPPSAQSVMLVWGTIVDGIPRVEPAFRVVAPSRLPTRAGAWRVELRDRTGGVIASYPFTPTEIHDGARPAEAFGFALPIDSATADGVSTIAVIGPTGKSEVTQSFASRMQARDPGPERSLTRTRAALSVDWSTDLYPMAMVRDAQTGQILSFVRGGKFTVPAGSPALDVLWSDGVRTRRERVVP